MIISFASDNDTPDVRHIWKECFGDTDSYMNAFFSSAYKPEQTLVAKIDGTTVGALQLFPHTIFKDGKTYNSIYIGGVSVLPEYRMQGISKKLMTAAEDHMQKNKIEISFLVPFSFAFYEKMGYKCISYLSEYSGKISALAPFVLPFEKSSCNGVSLSVAYHFFAEKFDLYLERNDNRFQNEIFPLCENCSVCLLSNNEGYLIYEIKNREFMVLEIAYKDERALRSLLGFIYNNKNICDVFTIRTAADGVLRKLLCENTIIEKRLPHAMAKTFGELKINDSMQNYINMLGWF